MASNTLTFDDEFDSLSLHRTWQAGDKWQLIAPDSTDGRGGPNWGEGGSQWWVNPYNPSTPANGIYSASNGQLNLSLRPTPASEQAYIDQQAGTHLPYVGGLLNNSPTNYQHYGLWEMRMAVDRVPGFAAEIALENVQLTGHWPPQLNIGVSTDGGGKQTLQAHMYYNGTSSDYSQGVDGTQQHSYGIDWEVDAITFYFDKAQVLKVANPGGVYQTDQMFAFLYTGANYSAGTGTNPPVASLPASAHVDYFRVYAGNPSSPPATSDTLMLRMSEDAYQGDAQFTVSVDGHQVDNTLTASVLHATSDSNVFMLTGNWGQGAHDVTIQFLNDAYGGSATTDRNLYVNSIAFDDKTYAGTTAALLSNGAKDFMVGGSTATTAGPADTLTVHLAEDAWNGDANFTVSIDGKTISTAQAVTASHSVGAWQDVTFSGNFGAGIHDVGISFTNDAYGGSASTDRNLYVNGVDFDGTHYGNGTTALYSNGTTHFTV